MDTTTTGADSQSLAPSASYDNPNLVYDLTEASPLHVAGTMASFFLSWEDASEQTDMICRELAKGLLMQQALCGMIEAPAEPVAVEERQLLIEVFAKELRDMGRDYQIDGLVLTVAQPSGDEG